MDIPRFVFFANFGKQQRTLPRHGWKGRHRRKILINSDIREVFATHPEAYLQNLSLSIGLNPFVLGAFAVKVGMEDIPQVSR
jgi:hypothetical protein